MPKKLEIIPKISFVRSVMGDVKCNEIFVHLMSQTYD